MSFQLSIGTRVRKSAYFEATVAAGVSHFSTYNHLYMPVSYGDTLAEYWRLIEGVSMWDVACQRQIELVGPDAGKLAQACSARDLSTAKVGQGKYVPMVDHAGRLINDPLVLRVEEDRWWFSIADGDILLWCRAVAAERGYDVAVTEADVSPLAVQGPKAVDVVSDLFGEWVRELKYFWYRPCDLDGIPVLVGRAGWAKQGGFELYLTDGTKGTELWNRVAEAGEPYGIGPGAPNYIERIESGLLSFRADTEDDTSPYEVGLGRWVDLDQPDGFIGQEALRARAEQAMRYELVGLRFVDAPALPHQDLWPIHAASGSGGPIGTVRAAAESPRVGAVIAMALVDVPHNEPGTEVVATLPSGDRCRAEVVALPFL